MLYLLAGVLLLLVCLIFLITRDILSPTLLLTGVFFVSCVFAILGNIQWKVSVSPFVVIVISLGILLIFCGEMVGREIKKKNVVSIVKGEQNDTQIKISSKVNLLIYFICFLSVILQGVRMIQIARENGYSSGGISIMFTIARNALINGTGHVGQIVGLMTAFVHAAGFIYTYIFIFNMFARRKTENICKTNWQNLIPLVFLIISYMLGTSRDVFILLVVYIFFIFFEHLRRRKKINIIKLAFAGIIVVILFFGVFYFLGKLSGRGGSFMDTIYIYAGSPIVAFDLWLQNGFPISTQFGAETFTGIHQFIGRFFQDYNVPSIYMEFIALGKNTTNIYTGFRAYFADFGWSGFILFSFLMGLFYGVAYMSLCYGKYKHLKKMIYAYFLFYLIYFFATPLVTTSLLSVTQLLDFFWIIVLYLLLKKNFYGKANFK